MPCCCFLPPPAYLVLLWQLWAPTGMEQLPSCFIILVCLCLSFYNTLWVFGGFFCSRLKTANLLGWHSSKTRCLRLLLGVPYDVLHWLQLFRLHFWVKLSTWSCCVPILHGIKGLHYNISLEVCVYLSYSHFQQETHKGPKGELNMCMVLSSYLQLVAKWFPIPNLHFVKYFLVLNLKLFFILSSIIKIENFTECVLLSFSSVKYFIFQ